MDAKIEQWLEDLVKTKYEQIVEKLQKEMELRHMFEQENLRLKRAIERQERIIGKLTIALDKDTLYHGDNNV
jgi:hypothetical protein